jgi:hypothetical protein
MDAVFAMGMALVFSAWVWNLKREIEAARHAEVRSAQSPQEPERPATPVMPRSRMMRRVSVRKPAQESGFGSSGIPTWTIDPS